MGQHMLRLLSDEGVRKMREEVIRILEDVGVIVNHDEALKVLEEAGAKVDRQRNLVRIPGDLFEECNKKLPQRIVIEGADSEHTVVLDSSNGNIYNRSMTGAEGYVDIRDGKYRKVVKTDVREFALVADALENIHLCTAPYYCDPDLNLNARDVVLLQILLETVRKPILMQPYGLKNTEYMVKMGIAVRGSEEELRKRPRFIVMTSPVPPLTYHSNEIDVMLCAGKYGLPLEITSMPICGAAAPVTVCGGSLLTLAEHAAGVVISQVAKPGAPIIFAPRTVCLDMSTGSALEGSAENAMISATETQVAKEAFGWFADMYGPTSDSLTHDAQCNIERTFQIIFSRCSGADILAGGGNYEHSYTMDPVQLAIDNDIFGMADRVYRDYEINDDTLGLDAIRRIGAGVERNYLIDPHTLKYFRTEHSRHKLMRHTSRENWEAEGAKDLVQRARERVDQILKEHNPQPLSDDVVRELRELSESAEKEITRMSTT